MTDAIKSKSVGQLRICINARWLPLHQGLERYRECLGENTRLLAPLERQDRLSVRLSLVVVVPMPATPVVSAVHHACVTDSRGARHWCCAACWVFARVLRAYTDLMSTMWRTAVGFLSPSRGCLQSTTKYVSVGISISTRKPWGAREKQDQARHGLSHLPSQLRSNCCRLLISTSALSSTSAAALACPTLGASQ